MPKNKPVSILSERGGEQRHVRIRQDFAHSASGHGAYKKPAEIEPSPVSGSLDLFNDDLAKRAVGNLFSKPESENEPDITTTESSEDSFFEEAKRQTKIRSYIAPVEKEDSEQASAVAFDGKYEDDDSEEEDEGVPVAGRSPLPMPKPAIKVNPALPYRQARSTADTSAVAAATGASRPLSMTRAAGSSGRASTMSYFQDDDHPVQSSEDDEFNEFRQRYSVRKAGTPQSEYSETTHTETAQIRPGSGRVPREGSAARRRNSDPAMRGINSGNGGDSFIWAVPPVIRIAVVAITVLFLLIMVFIVYRNSVLNRQLREAVAKIEEVTTANENNIKLREEASRDLDDANRRIDSLTAELEARPQATTPPTNVTQPTQTPTATSTPEATTPALPTSYTVVSGDTLSRIAIRYYNSASPDNITRILQANPQISNANAIRPGMVLIIPAQ